MDPRNSGAPVGRGVGPSVVGHLVRDRSLRLAAGLAIAVAIPVAMLFYFQFRSIADLGSSSSVVLRQLSHETADGLTRTIEDTLKLPVRQHDARRAAGTDRAVQPRRDLADLRRRVHRRAVHRPLLRLVGRDDRASRRAARLRSRHATSSTPASPKRRCWWRASRSWRRRSARSACSRRRSTAGAPTSRRSCAGPPPRARR